jgi:hypothetical protein
VGRFLQEVPPVRVQRLDLGVDVVVVPEQDLVILHPDLSFGQAVGAIGAALPELHTDVVVNLVSQVTQRPRSRRRPSALLAVPLLALAALLLGALVLSGGPEPYDQRWHNAVAALDLECDQGSDERMCVAPDGSRYEVTAWTRGDGALYVLRSEDRRRYVRSFLGEVPPEWLRSNPAAVVLSGSTVHWE